MATTGLITMSMREADRLKTLQAVIDGHLTTVTAAKRLQLSKRQVNRILLRMRTEGNLGVILALDCGSFMSACLKIRGLNYSYFRELLPPVKYIITVALGIWPTLSAVVV